ncbi:MAG: hypothetical protein ACK559_10760, partial [bacterium]
LLALAVGLGVSRYAAKAGIGEAQRGTVERSVPRPRQQHLDRGEQHQRMHQQRQQRCQQDGEMAVDPGDHARTEASGRRGRCGSGGGRIAGGRADLRPAVSASDDADVELGRLQAIPDLEEEVGSIDPRGSVGVRQVDDEVGRRLTHRLEARDQYIERHG